MIKEFTRMNRNNQSHLIFTVMIMPYQFRIDQEEAHQVV